MGREYPNTIIAGSRITAAVIAQLRQFITDDLADRGQSFPWSWTNVVVGDRILAKHFKEMRDAIQQLWNIKNRGPLPMWSSGVNPGGESLGTAPTRMFASDVTDLRIWLNQYEDNHPPALQGVDTKAYEIETDKLIAASWADDIAALRVTQPRLATRVNIRVKPRIPNVSDGECELSPSQRDKYRDGLLVLKNAGLERAFVVLGWEFVPAHRLLANGAEVSCGIGKPDDPLDPSDWANTYIRTFASRAAALSSFLVDAGAAQDFIIWNEPNNLEPILSATSFAALLRRCWNEMTSARAVYMGGIFINRADINPGLSYLASVYQALYANGKAGGDFGAWPWNGSNIPYAQ